MSKKQPLINAGEIIERFGGIRPMAAKIDTPVTTVQGWKKRDVIPGTRRTQILEAAHNNNIDISDLSDATVSNQNNAKSTPKKKVKSAQSAKPKAAKKTENKVADTAASVTATVAATSGVVPEEKKEEQSAPSSVPPVSSSQAQDVKAEPKKEIGSKDRSNHDRLLNEIEETNRKAISTNVWITTGLILLSIAVGAFLLWPNVKKNQTQFNVQSQQLGALENEVKEVKKETSRKFLGTSLPDNMQEKFDSLQNQARNLSLTVDQLSERAKTATNGAIETGSQAFAERLEQVESKIEDISGPQGTFAAVIERVKKLEASVTGQLQLESSADQLRSIMQRGVDGETIGDDLAGAQDEEDGALGKTLQGVSKEDLKAAAILIAFSQFRSSLEREAPFEEDLKLLQNLVGEDNPELQENLVRLSEHANGGVLTTSGLSSELKKLTGDIVVSSLTGEDVSIAEKAKARFGNLVQIEKEGELVSGTETQATVAKAQSLIDEGKVEESVVTLETLDGDAAKAAEPFIQKAKGNLLAQQVEEMLNSKIMAKVTGSVESVQNFEMPQFSTDDLPPLPSAENFNAQDIQNGIKKIIPYGKGEIIKDEESGIIILPDAP